MPWGSCRQTWRREGCPPLPHHLVCVEKFTLPYLTLGSELIELHPVVSCEGNDDMWGRILTQADARAMAAQAGL